MSHPKKRRARTRPRRHHNNKGWRQIRTGGCDRTLRRIAKRLRIRYVAMPKRRR